MINRCPRVRWWLATCALVASALVTSARAQSDEDVLRARCAPEALTRCEPTADPHKFLVNGVEHAVSYSEGGHYEASCAAAALDDAAWPRFPRAVRFELVTLRGCAPPLTTSYAAALGALNVTVGEHLELLDVPDDARFAAAALADLPPAVSRISLSSRDLLPMKPGALAELDGLRWLYLEQMYTDRLPRHLNDLHLRNTGLKKLPFEAFNVIHLTIDEKLLKSISGSAPRIRSVSAPLLRTLALSDADAEGLLSGFVEGCRSLGALSLQRARGRRLPPKLLFGADPLRSFNFTDSLLAELPLDLFFYSPNLKLIDLSFNRLEFLSSEQFSMLPQLETLVLVNNRLSKDEVRLVATLPALTTLLLSGNPLGDLCSVGPDSPPVWPPSSVRTLALARTNATRLCYAWLLNMPALTELDLRHNAVRRVQCADLRLPRYRSAPASLQLDLRHNPMRVLCDRAGYERLAADADRPETRLSVLFEWSQACECGAYWLWRAQGGRAAALFHADYAAATCADWYHCSEDEACGLIAPKGTVLVHGGREAGRGELPWHVGVYDKSSTPYRQICGGTLVSTRLVISAAHCFWADGKKQPASNYAIAVGKIYSQWDDPRDRDAQTSDVSSLELPTRYAGMAAHFTADVALVRLAHAVVFSLHARPACLDLAETGDARQLLPGALGKVGGWGLTSENGGESEILKVVDMPYVSVEECLADASRHFLAYITLDKICAGYRNGTAAVCKGDSGGGLTFPQLIQNTTRYYLRGVVSTAPDVDDDCNVQWLTTFTKLSEHRLFLAGAWVP